MRILIIGGFMVAGLSLSTLAALADDTQKENSPSTTPSATTDMATAQTGGPSSTENASAPEKEDPIVCKRVEAQTGSRVGARKVCRKASEWRAIQDGSREAVEGVQRSGTDLKAPGS